jgi:TetR/AcrR family transcriptional regulator, transcriptional repressor for nem operon
MRCGPPSRPGSHRQGLPDNSAYLNRMFARLFHTTNLGSISEFGNSDVELAKLRSKSGGALHKALVERLQEAKAAGEIRETIEIERAARFVETTMLGLQVAAKAGMSAQSLRDTAAFAIVGLRDR